MLGLGDFSEYNTKLRIHRKSKSDHEKIKFHLLQNIECKADLENIFVTLMLGKELVSFIYKKRVLTNKPVEEMITGGQREVHKWLITIRKNVRPHL